MPANRFANVFTNTVVANVPSGGTEGVVLTTPPLNFPYDGQPVLLLVRATINPGTSVTAMLLAIRRGTTITGPLVANSQLANFPVTAGTRFFCVYSLIDTPPPSGGLQYSFTVLPTGGVSPSGVDGDATMIAMCL